LNNIGAVKRSIYKQIHQICFHGKGGYSWPVIYNMPIYLRRFIFSEIKEFYDEQNKENTMDPSKNLSSQPSSPSSLSNKKPSVSYK
jgi:hypothetical protein